MIELSYGGHGIFLADICKCMPPGIAPAKTHNQLSGMGRYMACHHNKVAYNCTQSAPSDIAFLAGRSSAYRMLTNHAEDVVCNHPQFKNEGIRCELSGRKPFQIHVGLHLTVKLLTFPVGMVQFDDFPVRVAQVCPPGLNFYFRNEVELPIFVNGPFRNLVSGAKREIPVEALAGSRLPIAADVHGFPVPRAADILAVLLRHLKPAVPAFTAEIPFDNEETACVYKDGDIVNGIISGIQTYQQGLIGQPAAQPYPAWYSGPLLGVTIFGTLFLGIPLLLLGAWVCSRIAKHYLKATPPRNS